MHSAVVGHTPRNGPPDLFASGVTAVGRLLSFGARLSDRPGRFAWFFVVSVSGERRWVWCMKALEQSAALIEERSKSLPHSAELAILRLHQEALENLASGAPKVNVPKAAKTAKKGK